MRRVREAVHARHDEQYECKIQETRDGDYDEHFVGRVAHAVRCGVLHHVRRRRRWLWWPSRRVVAADRSDQHVVPAVMAARDDRGRTNDVGHRCHRCRSTGGRPSVRRSHFVVLAVVPDRSPSVCTATGAAAAAATAVFVVVHRRSTVADDHVLGLCYTRLERQKRSNGSASLKKELTKIILQFI